MGWLDGAGWTTGQGKQGMQLLCRWYACAHMTVTWQPCSVLRAAASSPRAAAGSTGSGSSCRSSSSVSSMSAVAVAARTVAAAASSP